MSVPSPDPAIGASAADPGAPRLQRRAATAGGLVVAGGVAVAAERIDALGADVPHREDAAGAAWLPAWRAREHIAARTLLRRLLTRHAGPRVAVARLAARDCGQPYLPEHPAVAVSLSHSGHWVAAAVGLGRAVGVDVQLPQPTQPGMRRRCCTAATAATLDRLPAAERDLEFAWLWTVQEACVKAAGVGLAGRPWLIPVDIGRQRGRWRDYRWRSFRDRPGPPLSCAYGEEAA